MVDTILGSAGLENIEMLIMIFGNFFPFSFSKNSKCSLMNYYHILK